MKESKSLLPTASVLGLIATIVSCLAAYINTSNFQVKTMLNLSQSINDLSSRMERLEGRLVKYK